MAIVKMNKFRLLSLEDRREGLLEILQNFNYVHFNDLKIDDDEDYIKEVKNTEKLSDIERNLNKVDYALELVNRFTNKKTDDDFKRLDIKTVREQSANFDFDLIYEKLTGLVKQRDEKLDQKQALSQRIEELRPWKDIDLNINELMESDNFYLQSGSVSSQFYDALLKALVTNKLDESLVYRLGEVDKTSFVIALSSLDEEEKLKDVLREFGFTRVRINSDQAINKDIKEKTGQIALLKQEVNKLEGEIADLNKYRNDFYIYQAFLINEKKKEESAEFFLKTEKLDIIEGYLPNDYTERFKEDLRAYLDEKYILEISEADKDDPLVPIILENNKIIQPYESIVETYALPRYNEMDPSLLVAIFYTIFTGFMIGDLGYGLVGLIGTIAILKLKDLADSTKKTVKLFAGISLSACFFGILFGSVFGGIIDVPFGWIDTQTDINTLIVMSLIIGGVSLFVALGLKAYMYVRDGKVLDAVYDVLFWYMAVGGPIAYFLTNNKVFLYIMSVGMVGIVLFAGRASKSIGGRIGSGLYELYGISSWVGDFVSFLRLMALVLSGGFVAYAVNVIVKMLVGGGVFGIVGGLIVFVIFQLFNMFLSYLSAYVHSLRLIYVEMFGKFYEGGGKKFREMLEDTKKIIINRGGNND